MLYDLRSGKEERMKKVFDTFGTQDRYLAGAKVNNACNGYSLAWKQKIMKIWIEMQEFFDIPEVPLMPVVDMETGDGPIMDDADNDERLPLSEIDG